LRLALLAVSAAAFLLVPAAQALAAPEAHVIIEGSGSGRVFGNGATPGTPPINCHKPSEVGDVCDTEMFENAGTFYIKVKHEAAAGSEFAGWEVTAGTPLLGCGAASAECTVTSTGADTTIKAKFKEPNVHILVSGEGSGKVVGVSPLEGVPPIDCEWNGETEVKSGVCDTEAKVVFGTAGQKVKYEEVPGSKFAGWHVVEGTVSSCEEFAETCAAAFPPITIEASFDLIPFYVLNLSTSGGGSGSFECDAGSGPEACQAAYEGGTEVTVTPVASTGSEFVEFTGDCSGASCELTMDEEHSAGAAFDLESVAFSITEEGEGTVQCEDATAGGGLGACAGSYPYGHTVKVVVAPTGENVVGSLTGSGSAEGGCAFEATNGSCEFPITVASGVSVVFAAGNTIATQKENVHGEVPQTTELATTCENDVDLGEFKPGEAANYVKTCGLTVTATGSENTLTAADETGNDTGYLTQKPTHPYSLPQALETKATGLPGLEFPGTGGGTFAALTSPVPLLSYGGPVSADNVTLTFRQKIGLHDALHTGVYSKTITLTLKQTAL